MVTPLRFILIFLKFVWGDCWEGSSSILQFFECCCPDFFCVVVWCMLDKNVTVFCNSFEGDIIAKHFIFKFKTINDFERNDNSFVVWTCCCEVPSDDSIL